MLFRDPAVAEVPLVGLQVADRPGFECCLCHFDRWLHTAEVLRLTALVGTKVVLRPTVRGSGDGQARACDGLGTQEAHGTHWTVQTSCLFMRL